MAGPTSRPARLPWTTAVAAPLALLASHGCADRGPSGAPGGAAGWQAVRDTVGDTLVVRTVEGSVWGGGARVVEEIRIGRLDGSEEYTLGRIAAIVARDDHTVFVLDALAPALRVYDADGGYLRTIGRQGGGPGEYNGPDGGLSLLPDGRILLRDPENERINVYAAGGEWLEGWPIRGGFSTDIPLFTDTASNAYHYVWDFEEDSDRSLVRYSPAGEPGDTLLIPLDYESPLLRAESENRLRTRRLPFAPRFHWSYSPLGYYVGGISDRYAVHLYRGDAPVLRIESAAEAVPVSDDERRNERALMIWSMRTVEPGWDWDGPDMPGRKPAFSGIALDADGRIWVRLHVPGERIPEARLNRDESDRQRPFPEYFEPVVYDVFEPDGAYLGRLPMPDGFQASPPPFVRGDRIWGVVTDDLDVQYVVRLRIETSG